MSPEKKSDDGYTAFEGLNVDERAFMVGVVMTLESRLHKLTEPVSGFGSHGKRRSRHELAQIRSHHEKLALELRTTLTDLMSDHSVVHILRDKENNIIGFNVENPDRN